MIDGIKFVNIIGIIIKIPCGNSDNPAILLKFLLLNTFFNLGEDMLFKLLNHFFSLLKFFPFNIDVLISFSLIKSGNTTYL